MPIYDQIAKNKFNSYLIFFFFILFFALFAYVVGLAFDLGVLLVPFALVLALLLSVGSFYYSDKIVLKMSRARPATREEHYYLKRKVEGLALAAGIPAPRIYVIDDTAPNAFATGRDPKHAVICVTTGLLSKLDRRELEGVIAHEMSHIKNFDIRFAMIITVLVGSVVLLSDFLLRSFLWGGAARGHRGGGRGGGAGGIQLVFIVIALVFAVLAPIVGEIMKLAISRKREYLADATSALLTRYPEGLARALEKLTKDKEPLEAANKATENLYIVNPLKGRKMRFSGLFSTHPPLEERVKRLRAM